MPRNLATQLIENHRIDGHVRPGAELGLRIDQTLTQDATGTTVMLELESMGLERVKTELSVQYVDHNLLQADHRNADDHEFLRSACRRFGVWYSPPGNGVSHPLHQLHFGIPGKTLLGSDSHTPAAGAMGMLAFGGGGVDVALAMAGEPLFITMPEIWGISLVGGLRPWVSAKDVILELLRRHDVDGGIGRILEFHGPGLASLTAMDRHVIANMSVELGATSAVFPADDVVESFMRAQGRSDQFRRLQAEEGATYDVEEELDLSRIEPLVAMPSSPGHVRPVREVEGEIIHQAYIGSSANPGFRDFAVVAEIVAEHRVHPGVSLDINPSTARTLADLTRSGHLERLIAAGARIHQAGCNGCIGMGQAPATNTLSLRTVPRNFPGRSGLREDRVCLVSPETAAASAVRGVITDPRELAAQLGLEHPGALPPPETTMRVFSFVAPSEEDTPGSVERVELVKGPNIEALPEFDPLPDTLELPVLLKVGDDISTDEILPAGARVLPYRSNIPKIAEFAFDAVDETYPRRAAAVRSRGGHTIVGGDNYGQGSSREHAALGPRFLGLRVVLARRFARIHHQNLVNFGVLPLRIDAATYDAIAPGDLIALEGLDACLREGRPVKVIDRTRDCTFFAHHDLSTRQVGILRRGGVINWLADRLAA
jgi:aconitate hydratase